MIKLKLNLKFTARLKHHLPISSLRQQQQQQQRTHARVSTWTYIITCLELRCFE